jgi:hypothetical protein
MSQTDLREIQKLCLDCQYDANKQLASLGQATSGGASYGAAAGAVGQYGAELLAYPNGGSPIDLPVAGGIIGGFAGALSGSLKGAEAMVAGITTCVKEEVQMARIKNLRAFQGLIIYPALAGKLNEEIPPAIKGSTREAVIRASRQ